MGQLKKASFIRYNYKCDTSEKIISTNHKEMFGLGEFKDERLKQEKGDLDLDSQADTQFQSEVDQSIEAYNIRFREHISSIPFKEIIVVCRKRSLDNQKKVIANQEKIDNQKQLIGNRKILCSPKQPKQQDYQINYSDEAESFYSSVQEQYDSQQFIPNQKDQQILPCRATRSKMPIPHKIGNLMSQIINISRPARNIPQTKFRYLDVKKRRIFRGPLLPRSIPFGVTKISQEQSDNKLNLEIYFSDEQCNMKDRTSIKLEDQQIAEPFPFKADEQFASFKGQEILTLKKEQLVPLSQYEHRQGKTVITRNNLSRMYEYPSLSIKMIDYCPQTGQDPFYLRLFQEALQDLSYKASAQRSSHILCKGRQFIVRRIMEAYCHIPPKQHKQQRYVRNRLTKKQAQLMNQAALPIPPPRLTSDFLTLLFANPMFALYYKEFVRCGRLEEVLMSRSKSEVATFGRYYKYVGLEKVGLQEKMRMMRRDPPPLSLLEVRLFMEEARSICLRYC